MNEADIPIDIHTTKLQEWLISRRIVPKDFQKNILGVRDRINKNITDMPAHEGLVKLLSGAHINYFHCQQIIEILKMTEADTKNVFGRYGSQRMKDWQEVVRLYEKDSLYLAEAAQILVRLVSYEIPGLRKQISKFEQLSDESEKKMGDLVRSQHNLQTEFNALCSQLGIKGDNVRDELIEKLKELPALLASIAATIPTLSKTIAFYTDYSGNKNSISLLRHVAAKGNTTVYEFVYNQPPLSVEEPSLKIRASEKLTEQDKIDFGDIEEIDFGDLANQEVTLETGYIDFGDMQSALEEAAAIDFNISLDDAGIVVEDSGLSGGVAKNEEAYTLLDSPVHREQFLDELYELEAFLKMRIYELSSTDNQVFSMMDNISDYDADAISTMLNSVDVVLTDATNPLISHLHQIKHSPKYVDILEAKLKQKLTAIETMKQTEVVLKEKSVRFLQEAVALRPKLAKIIEQTKILQKQIEKDISKRYKNRAVNLMGDINTL